MNQYLYDDYSWRVFGDVNTSFVFQQLNGKEIHRYKFNRFISYALTIMNFTNRKTLIHYEINEHDFGYSINILWPTTKVKAAGVQDYLANIKQNIPVETGITEWRRVVYEYLQSLYADYQNVEFSYALLADKVYMAHLYAEVTFEKLVWIEPEKMDKNTGFDPQATGFFVPIELLHEVLSEKHRIAIQHFGIDHEKLINVMTPLSGKDFWADFLIAITYHMFLNLPNKAYDYYKRASELIGQYNSESTAYLFEFMGDIELNIKNDNRAAEQSFLKSLLLGNQTGLLNLAYFYLQQIQSDKKDLALFLVKFGEKILSNDKEEENCISGYHIIASVYLWDKQFENACRTHHHFFSNAAWCKKYHEFVEAYLILSFAINDFEFIFNIVSDYPVVIEYFDFYIDTWRFAILDHKDERFSLNMIPVVNQINEAKRLYGF